MADAAANPIERSNPSDATAPGAGSVQPAPEPAAPAAAPAAQAAIPVRMSASEPTEFYALLRLVVGDASLTPVDKQKLIDELRKTTPTSDRWTFRWAIWILGAVVLLTIGALWALSFGGHSIPDGLVAIGSGAAGGLAGLLTPGRDQSQ